MKDYDEHGWGKDKPPKFRDSTLYQVGRFAFFIAMVLVILYRAGKFPF